MIRYEFPYDPETRTPTLAQALDAIAEAADDDGLSLLRSNTYQPHSVLITDFMSPTGTSLRVLIPAKLIVPKVPVESETELRAAWGDR